MSSDFKAFQSDASVTGVNAFQVAKLANAGFDQLAKETSDVSRTFIAVGNLCPWVSLPSVLGLSAGKRVLANVVEAAAGAYGPAGKRYVMLFLHAVLLRRAKLTAELLTLGLKGSTSRSRSTTRAAPSGNPMVPPMRMFSINSTSKRRKADGTCDLSKAEGLGRSRINE